MRPAEARRLLAGARVAVLGTIGPGGRPDLVPVSFAVAGDTILTAVDGKPKRTTALQRHANLRRDPRASLLAQQWDEDWSALWWVRASGSATLHDDGPEVGRALDLLRAKYPQYQQVALGPPVVVVAVTRWTGWQATPSA
jgi:PPOX class probable F420-dependent enzyme